MQPIHRIKQSYWFSPQLPQVESRSTWQSPHAYKTHSHPQLSLGAIVAGSTVCHYRGRQHVLHAGDLVLIDPHSPHSCNPLPGQTRSYHMLYIDTDWCLALLAQHYDQPIASLSCHAVSVRDPALFHAYQNLLASLYQQDIATATAELNAVMTTVLLRYCTPGQPAQEQLTTRYIRQRLLDNLQESPSLSALAQELNLRRETLVRHFRDDTGTTPMAFLNNARIEYAKSLLRQGMPLVDACYESGFSDQSHFHKIFVLHTAATPGQYRHACQQDIAAITI